MRFGETGELRLRLKDVQILTFHFRSKGATPICNLLKICFSQDFTVE